MNYVIKSIRGVKSNFSHVRLTQNPSILSLPPPILALSSSHSSESKHRSWRRVSAQCCNSLLPKPYPGRFILSSSSTSVIAMSVVLTKRSVSSGRSSAPFSPTEPSISVIHTPFRTMSPLIRSFILTTCIPFWNYICFVEFFNVSL